MTDHYRIGSLALSWVAGRSDLTKIDYQQLAQDLGTAMHNYGIVHGRVCAMFIAQTCEESGAYRWPEELASGAEYEGRDDLGNTHSGDGVRYKGRGYIQITGRSNYEAISKALGVDFVAHPAKLSNHRFAAVSAAWWWAEHGLNKLALNGSVEAVTRVINGGVNGLAEREAFFAKAEPRKKDFIPQHFTPDPFPRGEA